ncbi:MAG: PQQ-binding-like beta-propeller repeat protein, partial [Verrucomicrobia bacterium]|nr:PQQ-binding-like beta-propeller repeat protein [Verrucomicrobiota bacterium]
MKRISLAALGALGLLAGQLVSTSSAAPAKGWLAWRGPQQNGTSLEKNLPDSIDVKKPLWVADFPGQSAPVIANGKLYIMGYLGDGPELQEGVGCFDAETGKKLWEKRYSDFLSDTIYLRYATSSPAVDPETGNVYMLGTQGMLAAFTADGKELWSYSMMESFGRLTFPNSRTASPLIDGDLVIVRGITSNWGNQGAAGDRIYGFDKKTGDIVWACWSGERPKDNSFSHPYLTWFHGKRVFITATGDGNVLCGNARTGEPIWRVPLFKAGINSTTVVHNNDKVVAIYGTPYEPGQMVCMKIPDVEPTSPTNAPVVVERQVVELWNVPEISTSTSHPILVGDRVYVVAEKGDLCCVDINNGKVLWRLKLGIEQRNAGLVHADGKLYVPMLDDPASKASGDAEAGTTGAFYIIKPSDKEGKILSHVPLDGRCFGTPSVYNGKIYMQTTRHLYCFGKPGNNSGLAPEPAAEKWPAPGPAAQLQIVPSEVLMHPGETASFRIRSLDKNGLVVQDNIDPKSVTWASFIPPTARVRSTMKGSFNADGKLVADKETVPSAGAFMATLGNLKGTIRGRVLPGLPIREDFEKFELVEKHATEEGVMFAYPPLPWIGPRFKFEVRQVGDTKALVKAIDNKFFQRASVFLGEPTLKNYTVQTDMMSEGKPRKMSEVGQINQRYLIVMKGNSQEIEVNSNQERLKVAVPFKWKPNEWY